MAQPLTDSEPKSPIEDTGKETTFPGPGLIWQSSVKMVSFRHESLRTVFSLDIQSVLKSFKQKI